jgi:hypothetical protein
MSVSPADSGSQRASSAGSRGQLTATGSYPDFSRISGASFRELAVPQLQICAKKCLCLVRHRYACWREPDATIIRRPNDHLRYPPPDTVSPLASVRHATVSMTNPADQLRSDRPDLRPKRRFAAMLCVHLCLSSGGGARPSRPAVSDRVAEGAAAKRGRTRLLDNATRAAFAKCSRTGAASNQPFLAKR